MISNPACEGIGLHVSQIQRRVIQKQRSWHQNTRRRPASRCSCVTHTYGPDLQSSFSSPTWSRPAQQYIFTPSSWPRSPDATNTEYRFPKVMPANRFARYKSTKIKLGPLRHQVTLFAQHARTICQCGMCIRDSRYKEVTLSVTLHTYAWPQARQLSSPASLTLPAAACSLLLGERAVPEATAGADILACRARTAILQFELDGVMLNGRHAVELRCGAVCVGVGGDEQELLQGQSVRNAPMCGQCSTPGKLN
jgi:hypothetical protein